MIRIVAVQATNVTSSIKHGLPLSLNRWLFLNLFAYCPSLYLAIPSSSLNTQSPILAACTLGWYFFAHVVNIILSSWYKFLLYILRLLEKKFEYSDHVSAHAIRFKICTKNGQINTTKTGKNFKRP